MRKLTIKNKLIYISFYLTLAVLLVFGVLYSFLNLESKPDMLIGIGFIMLLITNIFFVVFINELIIKDVDKLRAKLQRVGNGKLNEGFDTKRQDEIGEIFIEVEKIIKNQHLILDKVKINSDKIEDSSKKIKLLIIENKDLISQLSNNMENVNQGTSNQIRGIEEIEVSVEEMVMGIKRINSTVLEVSENSGKSIKEAIKGNNALEKVVIQMDDIRKNSENSTKTITLLGEQIKEIQKIVDVIRNISSRTNLLALNATIEAERAGENGEGFVVVAEEIKDLATKSTQSTVKIEKISRNIIERKDKAIEIIEKSGKDIMQGISVVNEASQAFHKILNSTDDIGNQLNELSSSSEQLSSNAHQIVQSIEKTSKIANGFSENTTNIEAFVEQQVTSIDKLIESINSLEEINEEIVGFLDGTKKGGLS